jgi:thiamine biosynthesis lipoprotein
MLDATHKIVPETAVMNTHSAMGTVMVHRAYGQNAEACLEAVQMEIERLEGLLSRFLPDSDVSRINRSAGVRCEKVTIDTFEVLSKAVEFTRRAPGYFDATIDPLAALWRAAGNSLRIPDDMEIHIALSLVNIQDVILDPWNLTAGMRRTGQSIDLGGIAKGYAGDRIARIYRQFGVVSAFSNLGGNVVTVGTKPDGAPWRVGIRHPRDEEQLIGCVCAVDQSVVTSGDYQRFFTDLEGVRRHHILSPVTGWPANSGLASVTIVARRSIAADALATMVFAAGMEKGMELLGGWPGVEAVLVDEDCRVFVTRGVQDQFQADDGVCVNILNNQ